MIETIFHQNSLLNFFYLIIFLVFNLAIFVGWVCLYNKKSAGGMGRTALYAFISYILQLVTVALVLGYCSALYRSTYILVNLSLSVFLLYGFRDSLKSLIASLTLKIRQSNKVSLTISALILLFILSRNFYVALLNIPAVGDDIFYHIPTIFQYITSHKISNFNTLVIYQDIYPFNADLLFLNPAIFFKSDVFILLYHNLLLFSGFILVGYDFLRLFGVRKLLAFCGGIALLLTPAFFNGGFSGYTDALINLSYVSALFFFVAILKEFPNKFNHYLFILMLFFIAGSKYTGISFALFWGVLYLIFFTYKYFSAKKAFSNLRLFSTKKLLLLLFAFFILTLSWYLKNWIAYGNPVVPQKISILGHEFFTSKYKEGSFFNLQIDHFKPIMSDKGNMDFTAASNNNKEFDNSLQEKIDRIKVMYYSFPEYYFSGASVPWGQNQLGRIWAYLGMPMLVLLFLWSLIKKEKIVFVFLSLSLIFYLGQHVFLIYNSRFSSFIVILGVFATFKILSLIKSHAISRIAAWIILVIMIIDSWGLGVYASSKTNNRLIDNYSSGNYFAINGEQNYLTCYDFARTRISNKRIAYIGLSGYAFTYQLYGKGLSNKVYYYYTLDPEQWYQQIKKDDIDLVAYIGSGGEEKKFGPLLEFLKTNPEKFSSLKNYEPAVDDAFNICREYFFYKVK